MRPPNLNEEKKLWKLGYKKVAGLDEAGRGPLAGPVVAAAVVLLPNARIFSRNFGIRDSKKLSEKQREYFYGILTNHPQIKWGTGIVSEKVIDKINILQATKLAMKRAFIILQKKIRKDNYCHISSGRRKSDKGCFLLIDGNFGLDIKIPQKSIIRADEKIFSCAAAGIIAKVTRDRIMQKYHKKYLDYDFGRHKGYPTKAHFAALKKFGPCKIHRKSFCLSIARTTLRSPAGSLRVIHT